ncbi:hypothetical protein GHK86_04890 [Acidimicrobiaceae bacterium USS-CC1]|uniref:Glycosyltransferase RgtA/B/C/D-like domain-containing protein n=1 Tax=Acidiferrimicrobium australe TaxID=2664430 RepID=A0ABW9QQY5_9ACTN|nr:hypothetical protein [Acidiferrimicrobium australe]
MVEKQTLTHHTTKRLPLPFPASHPKHLRRRVPPAALPIVVIGQSLFLLLLAIAYALARSGYPARPLYWVGECGLVAVLVAAVGPLRLGEDAAYGVAFSTGLTSYLAMVLYDPFSFTFLDEYQHLQTATALLRSHSFAVGNTVLQVSPEYPGLEINADLVHRATGLSLVTCAYVTDGIYHVVAVLLVYAICRQLVGDAPAAVVGMAVFTFSPQFQFVDSYFTYSCLAITLGLAALYGTVMSATSPRRGWWWPAVGILCGVGCAVTHHVTSFAVAALFVLVAAVATLGGAWSQARRLWTVALPVAAFTLVWTVVVGTRTIAYLRSGIGGGGGVSSAAPHFAAGIPLDLPVVGRAPAPSSPAGDVVLELVGYAALAVLVAWAELTGGRVWLRRWRREPIAAVLTVSALAVLGLGAVREAVLGGSELASRTFVYVMLPAAFVVARRYEEVRSRRVAGATARRSSWFGGGTVPLAPVALGLVIWSGTLAAGWPAWYARLPGPAEPAAWDRSVDPALLACARWVATHEPRDQYIAGDQLSAEIVAAVARERVSLGATPTIFLARRATPALGQLARSYGIDLIIVDAAIDSRAPLDGSYFADDPLSGRYRSGLPAADIRKFQHWPGASVVYSNGRYSVVDLRGNR